MISTAQLRFFLLPLLVVLTASLASAQPVGPAELVVIEHADSLIGRSVGGEEIIEGVGHVRFSQGVVKITADRAILYRGRNRVVLIGDVHVTQPDLSLTAPRAEYDGTTRLAIAPSGVTLVDGGATLTAGSGDYDMNIRKARFRNGVTLRDGKSTLRAGSGDYYSIERKAVFRENVEVRTDSGTITAREITHWRDSQESFAIGKVVLVSKSHSARLSGDTLRHQPAIGYTLATGSAKLVQIDTVARTDSAGRSRRDTTIITSGRMEAFRQGRQEYLATDSVRLRRGDLQAVAAIARFLPDENLIGLGRGASSRLSDTSATGRRDTANAVTGGGGEEPRDRLSGIDPVVWYDKSQLTGDTITVRLLEKKLRSIDVQSNAFAVTEGKLPKRYDQLAGSRLFFDVLQDTIRQVRSEGLASSIVFVYDGDQPNGVNRASGDTITIGFDAGEATTIRVIGKRARAEGEYFPELLVDGQEINYRLDGFRWYGRDGSVDRLSGTLPRAPSIPEVRPPKE